jgi:hypothetical protein
MRALLTCLALFALASSVEAGHTRPAYVDGCQSMDGRYVVTAEYVPPTEKGRAVGGWKYTWKDTKTGKSLTGKLQGLRGVDHFTVTYAHMFMAPDGETFAVFNTAAYSHYENVKVGGNNASKDNIEALKKHPGLDYRLVVYRKTGEVVKRLDMRDILKDNEWVYLTWVQGNLYWLTEYPDVMKNGEPPRVGWRYFRVSPDYTVLEFVVGPNRDAVHKLKDQPKEVQDYRRTVRISLTDGTFLDPGAKSAGPNKVPARPFVGELVKRGDAMKNYVPSLDPVRVAGKVRE